MKTNFPVCYIQGLEIAIADYGYTDSCNGCESFRVSIGFSEDNYHYVSELIPLVKNSMKNQSYNFINSFILGTYIKIEFFYPYLRWEKKENYANEIEEELDADADNLFYIAFGLLDIYGIELATEN